MTIIGDSNPFPLLTLAADLIPEYWEIVEDVAPSALNINDLKLVSVLEKGKNYFGVEKLRKRAVAMKGNLGLADAKRFLLEQKIPQGSRGI